MKRIISALLVIALCALTLPAIKCGNGGGGGGTEYVQVEVCAESGLLPNKPWCPALETRQFEKGKEPTAVCDIHKEPPPPPPLQARLVVWAADLLAGQGDKIKFIQAVADAVGPPDGMVYVRVFLCSSWNREWPQPWQVVARWNAGYALPADALPFYDLTADNAEWWENFRAVLAEMKRLGIGIVATLEDRTSFMGSWEKYLSPFCSNIQDRDPDDPEVNRIPGGVWGLGENSMEKWHRAWFWRVVSELTTSGVDFYVEVTNEFDSLDNPATEMVAWHQHRVDDLRAAGVPLERIVGSAVREGKAIASQVGVYSLHGFVRPQDIAADYLAITGRENRYLLLSGDGGFEGAGRPDAKGRRGASTEQAYAIGQLILGRGYFGYEVMDRGLYLTNNDIGNYSAWDPEPTKALARALRGLGR